MANGRVDFGGQRRRPRPDSLAGDEHRAQVGLGACRRLKKLFKTFSRLKTILFLVFFFVFFPFKKQFFP